MATKARITITEDHLKLLGRMYVDWDDCEYGAPAIDPKRPYGNSDVEGDVAEILGWEVDEDEGLTDEQSEQAYEIHHEMQEVLQIVVRLAAGSQKLLGEWRNSNGYGVDWEKQ